MSVDTHFTANGVITETMFGYESHGITIASLRLVGKDFDAVFQSPIGKSLHRWIRNVLTAAGVARWEDLEGRVVRCMVEHNQQVVTMMSHAINDAWFPVPAKPSMTAVNDDEIEEPWQESHAISLMGTKDRKELGIIELFVSQGQEDKGTVLARVDMHKGVELPEGSGYPYYVHTQALRYLVNCADYMQGHTADE